jgi:hypothetical protein
LQPLAPNRKDPKVKRSLALVCLLILAACSSNQVGDGLTSSEARTKLQEKYKDKVGNYNKTDFIEEFGSANWCRPKEPGGETCRFYKKIGTKWIGEEGRDKKNLEMFDEIVAEFDGKGMLRSYEANAQR